MSRSSMIIASNDKLPCVTSVMLMNDIRLACCKIGLMAFGYFIYISFQASNTEKHEMNVKQQSEQSRVEKHIEHLERALTESRNEVIHIKEVCVRISPQINNLQMSSNGCKVVNFFRFHAFTLFVNVVYF